MTRWDAEQVDKDFPREWPEWTDILGQTYRAGDYVIYAMISGRSPQQVVAKVERINRVNSKRQEITTEVWDTPDRSYARDAKRVTIPYCTVTVRPAIDARGFGRYSEKAVTLSIPENIIKVDAALIEALQAKTAADLQDLSRELSDG